GMYAQLQRGHEILLLGVTGDHDNLGVGADAGELADQIQPIGAREPDVEKDNVRLVVPRERHSLGAIRRLANQVKLLLILKEQLQTIIEQGMIFDRQDTEL